MNIAVDGLNHLEMTNDVLQETLSEIYASSELEFNVNFAFPLVMSLV